MKTAGALISTVAGILAFFAAIGSLLYGVGTSLLGTSDSTQNLAIGIIELVLCLFIAFWGSVSLKSKKIYVGIFIILCAIINGILGGLITKILMVVALIGGIIATISAKQNN